MPDNIKLWFEAFGKSHNTAPEYVFVGALVTATAIMGGNSFVKVRETYKEPTNLYAICVGHPGSGKSQAFNMTVRDPLESMAAPLSNMLVDDYTKKGLFRHLQYHEGRAYLAHEEMGSFFDLVQKRQLEGNAERQLYCRLYDGGKWISTTGVKKSEGRQETKDNCVCLYGFVQPQPFIERIYAQLTEMDDRFMDRLLLCFPNTRVLLTAELDEWRDKLKQYAITSLEEPLKLVAEWHTGSEGEEYTFSPEGMQVYREFADEMAVVMNTQWDSGVMLQGNVSKDKRSLIRLSGVLHNLYKAIEFTMLSHDIVSVAHSTPIRSGSSSPLPLPAPLGISSKPSPIISEEEVRMAVALTEYFQEQRKVCGQVLQRPGIEHTDALIPPSLSVTILSIKGAFCTPRQASRCVTTKKKPTSAMVIEEMKSLADGGLGTFKKITEKEKVYYKPLPTEENKDKICKVMSFENYRELFSGGMDKKTITEAQFHRLVQNSPDEEVLKAEYGYEEY